MPTTRTLLKCPRVTLCSPTHWRNSFSRWSTLADTRMRARSFAKGYGSLSGASRRKLPDYRPCAPRPMSALLIWQVERSPTSMMLAHWKAIWRGRPRVLSLVERDRAECAKAPLAHPALSGSRTRFRRDRRVDCGDIWHPSGQDVPAYADARARSASARSGSAR